MATKNRIVSVLLATVAVTLASAAQAAVLFSDNFDSNTISADRQSGSAVYPGGVFTGIDYVASGSATWAVNAPSYPGVLSAYSVSGGSSVLNHDFGAVTDVVVSAKMSASQDQGWIGLMGQSTTPNNNQYYGTSPNVGVSVMLWPTRGYQFFVNGKAKITDQVTAADSYDVSLEVVSTTDPDKYLVNMWINGTEVVTGYSATGLSSFTNNYVGLGCLTGGSTKVQTWDNLTVTTPIPEPSTIALLSAGLIGLLAYAWRKRK